MTGPDFADGTLRAAAAVEVAARLAAERLTGDREHVVKGPRDVATDADLLVEDTLREAAAADGITLVGEERGGEAPSGEAYWLVDPICGTNNFAHRIPLYSTNLAVVVDGVVSASVVAAAATGELLVAERGRGAWARQGDGWHPVAADAASQAVSMEAGRPGAERRALAATLTAAVLRSDRWEVLALGSTMTLAFVATGRLAGYVLAAGRSLHFAAGAFLAEEAGAVVTDLDGAPWSLATDALVVGADEATHAALLAEVSAARSR